MESLITRALQVQTQRVEQFKNLEKDLDDFLSGDLSIDFNASCSRALTVFKDLSNEMRGLESSAAEKEFKDLATLIRVIQDQERSRLHQVVQYIQRQIATLRSFERCTHDHSAHDHQHTHSETSDQDSTLTVSTLSSNDTSDQNINRATTKPNGVPQLTSQASDREWKQMWFQYYEDEDKLFTEQPDVQSSAIEANGDDKVNELFQAIEQDTEKRKELILSTIEQQRKDHVFTLESINDSLNEFSDELRCLLLDITSTAGTPPAGLQINDEDDLCKV